MKIGESGKVLGGYNCTLLGILKNKYTYGIFLDNDCDSIYVAVYTPNDSTNDFKELDFHCILSEANETFDKSIEDEVIDLFGKIFKGNFDSSIDFKIKQIRNKK